MHPYHGIKIAIPTKHGKGTVIERALREFLDVSIEEVEVDTDLLGTFSGEVERIDSPFETALKKIDLLEGYDFVIASEGSIGPDSAIPFLISDIELLVFKELKKNIVIKESHKSYEIKAFSQLITSNSDLEDFLSKSDFPNHSLIVKSKDHSLLSPIKGINNKSDLDSAIKIHLKVSSEVVIESDLRANQSPSRMQNIYKTAQKLGKRIATLCPICNSPGFGLKGYKKGVICLSCNVLNPDALSMEILGCVKCEHEENGAAINKEITPDKCIWCNP
jgi:hypothetical protein